MHFLLQFQGLVLGVVVLAMIAAPALVAARSGKEETQPESAHDEEPVQPQPVQPRSGATRRVATPVRTQEVIMPISKAQPAPDYSSSVLPIHGRMGMAGR